jgi:hypothetical protein
MSRIKGILVSNGTESTDELELFETDEAVFTGKVFPL